MADTNESRKVSRAQKRRVSVVSVVFAVAKKMFFFSF
jgi:hypothetical protein